MSHFFVKSLGISPHPLFTLKCDQRWSVSSHRSNNNSSSLLRSGSRISLLSWLCHSISHIWSPHPPGPWSLWSVSTSLFLEEEVKLRNRRKCCLLEMLIFLLGFITNTALAKVVVVKKPHLPPGWTKHFRFPIRKYLPQWNIAQVFYQ